MNEELFPNVAICCQKTVHLEDPFWPTGASKNVFEFSALEPLRLKNYFLFLELEN